MKYPALKISAALLAVISVIILSSCSTTKRLGENEVLYTGVKKLEIVPTDKEKLPSGMLDDVKQAINFKPNNPMPFMSPYKRTPFPIGLWVYNNMSDSAKGLKGAIYRWLAKEPILISDVKAQTRTEVIEQILDNNGYFGSTATYTVNPDKKNDKKASITYTVDVSKPYLIDSLIYLRNDSSRICNFIDSIARRNVYLQKGQRFCIDSLKDARIDIVNRMRNRGYYFFRPEYIEFLADSLINRGAITLKLTLASNIPELALKQYRTRNIYTYILRRSTRNPGTPDTIDTKRGDLIIMRPSHIRPNTITSGITFREGKLFSVRDMNNTQTRLSRLGIFSGIQIQPVIADSVLDNPELDVYITCRLDRPLEASVEVDATSKSNSYIGPGLILGVTHNNLFGGAEKLSLKLNADYEWQTGSNRGSTFNSYEFGLTASLAFPRLLAPSFIRRRNRDLNWTTISLGANLLNHPHYFKMAEFNAGINYQWNSSRNVMQEFTPLKISYTKLINSTFEFDSIMAINPAVALSFQSQFIPQMSYSYTLDKALDRSKMNQINFSFTITEAGNIFDGIYTLCGVKGEKKLFGIPFSQFVKGQVQFIYNRKLSRYSDQWLVSRIMTGVAHAYGNSSQVPYSEQFYVGGANSIRAFTVRSIGPGSYKPPRDERNGYFDQTGTFKLELNTEYRFPIVSVLHGAAFIDAGNVWLLKNDPLRPGGQLKAKTFLRDIALGTGVGLRVDIGMLVIRGDLGYGLHTPYSNGTGHYFNVTFKKAFAFHLAIGYPF